MTVHLSSTLFLAVHSRRRDCRKQNSIKFAHFCVPAPRISVLVGIISWNRSTGQRTEEARTACCRRVGMFLMTESNSRRSKEQGNMYWKLFQFKNNIPKMPILREPPCAAPAHVRHQHKEVHVKWAFRYLVLELKQLPIHVFLLFWLSRVRFSQLERAKHARKCRAQRAGTRIRGNLWQLKTFWLKIKMFAAHFCL